ncbi:hypothetical protein Trydic_g15833 [Trypoxylus dichotomus]
MLRIFLLSALSRKIRSCSVASATLRRPGVASSEREEGRAAERNDKKPKPPSLAMRSPSATCRTRFFSMPEPSPIGRSRSAIVRIGDLRAHFNPLEIRQDQEGRASKIAEEKRM